MNVEDWRNSENLYKLADFIEKHQIVDVNKEILKQICGYLKVNQRRANGKVVNHTKIRVMFLHTKRYLKSKCMGINCLNISNGILYLFVKNDKDIIKRRLSEYLHIDKNFYVDTKDLINMDLAEQCSCSAEERCGPQSKCCNR